MSKPIKSKGTKTYTRMQAERLLSKGADPEPFATHPNYHVKRKAWTKMGKPLPSDPAERTKFLASIKVKETVDAAAESPPDAPTLA
jgi:hypothetical protein